jgi:hypothetical protein
MGKVVPFVKILVGVAIWVGAISAEISWLTFCFGTVIIGLLLLIFARPILLMPLMFLGSIGNRFLLGGIDGLYGQNGVMLKDRLTL